MAAFTPAYRAQRQTLLTVRVQNLASVGTGLIVAWIRSDKGKVQPRYTTFNALSYSSI